MTHHDLFNHAMLLAQAEGDGGSRGYSVSWAIVVFSVILGMLVALRPSKREDEVKKPKKVAE